MTVHIEYDDWIDEDVDDEFIITSISVDFLEPNAQDSDPDESAGGRAFWSVQFADRLRRVGGRSGADVTNRISRRRTPAAAAGSETGTVDGSPIAIADMQAEAVNVGFNAANADVSFAYASPGAGPRPGSYIQRWVTQADPDWPCSGLGIFYWIPLIEAEVWYEIDLSGGVDADWIGVRFSSTTGADPTPDLSGVPCADCRDKPWIYGWGYPSPSELRDFIELGPIDPFAAWEVFIPRNLLTADTNALVIAPAWHAGGSYCGSEIVDNSRGPLIGGEGGSRRYEASSDVSVTCVSVEIAGTGRTQWVPGVGDIDGTNAEFELSGWDLTGVPEARIDGLILAAADYAYDSGAGTVTFPEPPPVGSSVAFRYSHS